MPTIAVDPQDLRSLIGKGYKLERLAEDLQWVKGELKGEDPETGRLRIELNDTNRPDLWSAAGIARQIRCARSGRLEKYDFFSAPPGPARILVDPQAEQLRPFVAGFLARGPAVTEASLAELIQSQEKLCEGYGGRRKTVSMGIYRAERIRFPVHYRMVEPRSVRFVPLGFEEEMNLQQILERHPKGIEYAWTLEGLPLLPLLQDKGGGILSNPPIINSRAIGEVVPGDRELLVESTGTDLRSVLLIQNIMAVDLADRGYAIEPVVVHYPYQTPLGRKVRVPYPLVNRVRVPNADFSRLLGERLPLSQVERHLRACGCTIKRGRGRLEVATAPYRQDYMHPVDAIEDLAIALGLNNLEPIWPERFTPGHLQPLTLLEDKVRELMIGLSYEEIIANVLAAREDLTERLRLPKAEVVGIANVMSESYSTLRWTILAALLGVEQRSAKTPFPHHTFEVGEVVVPDPADNHGSRTESLLGALSAHPQANFSELHSVLNYLMFYLGCEAKLRPLERGCFLSGRGAEILISGRPAGSLGELHPEVLESWGVKMPASYLELRIAALPPPRTL
ncbi:MAG TPA: phenylalanine--tRNA ligase subunit beta [Acidobacteriota bacterium]